MALRRREFLGAIGGGLVTWPFAARAQQPNRMRLIGVLQGVTADDAQGKVRFAAFQQELQQLGWIDGHNVRFNHRWCESNADLMRRQAAELIALAPDVILTTGGHATAGMLKATRTGPVVFTVGP